MTEQEKRPEKQFEERKTIRSHLSHAAGVETVHKLLEGTPPEQEALHRLLVEQIPAIFWSADRQLRLTACQGAGLGALNLDPGAAVGKSVADFLGAHAPDAPAITAHLRALAGESLAYEGEWMGRAYQNYLEPLRERDGSISGCIGLAFDITEHKRAEDNLRQSNQTLEALVQAAPLAILALDLEGQVRFWNPAAARLFGWTEAEVIGRSDPTVPEERQAEFHALLERAAAGEPLGDLESRRQRKDGSAVDVRIATAPLRGARNQVTGALVLFTDVTEHRQLEAQLRQLQKLEAVSRLAGGIAHDFNNLLTVILGRSEVLLASVPADELLREGLEEIKKASERAADLTRQLLALSRKQVLRSRVLDLNVIVADMQNILARLLGEEIVFTTALAPALGPIKADPGQVEQVLLNLVVNARDAMPQGGTLTIETANVELDEVYARTHPEVHPGGYSLLAVSDTGCGMTEEVKAHLFEPFFTTKDKGKGTGLGLATVYGIIKQSGGHITAYSELGRGTTFRAYFPHADGTVALAEPEKARPQLAGGSETILVVEDEQVVRELVGSMLRQRGYTVLSAANGPEALRLEKQHPGPIDLLLTDVVMRDMSGPELAERLAASRPQMRVLYMSGYTGSVILRRSLLKADTPFLSKPFTPAALTNRVREALQVRPPAADQR